MLHVRIVCVGKLKEKYFREAESEYVKRLRRYCDLKIIEIKDETPKEDTPRGEEVARRAEGDKIISHLKGYVIACDVRGRQMNSEDFASLIESIMLDGDSAVTFLIGSSTGLSDFVLARADMRISFSKMTMPHRLFRIVLLEQIYRGFRIVRGEAYHK